MDVHLLTIPAFATRDTIHVVVESPRGSHLKLKYDPRWEAMGISLTVTGWSEDAVTFGQRTVMSESPIVWLCIGIVELARHLSPKRPE